jgi:hypothetical protein
MIGRTWKKPRSGAGVARASSACISSKWNALDGRVERRHQGSAMTTWIRACLTGLAFAFSIGQGPRAEPVASAPPAAIGGGAPVWIDSVSDPAFALINARVDVGTLRQVGDAIEAEISWTLKYGMLRDVQADRPGLTIPEGSRLIERQRIVCRPDGPLGYRVETTLVAPDGNRIDRRAFEPDRERRKSEDQETRRSGSRLGYHPDPPSLVCWAVARKCDDKPMSWPPPPNHTPLENSERAARMNSEYDRMFVPRCTL